jgi:hypothetical protein
MRQRRDVAMLNIETKNEAAKGASSPTVDIIDHCDDCMQ